MTAMTVEDVRKVIAGYPVKITFRIRDGSSIAAMAVGLKVQDANDSYEVVQEDGTITLHAMKDQVVYWFREVQIPPAVLTYDPIPEERSWFRRLMRPGGD